MITREEIERGALYLTAQERAQREKEILAYNDIAAGFRHKMNRLQNLEGSFLGVNSILVAAMIYVSSYIPFVSIYVPAWGYALLGFNFVMALLFAFGKKNMLIPSLFSMVTPFVNLSFVILPVLNFLIMLLYRKGEKEVRDQPGYPKFFDIKVYPAEEERRPQPMACERPMPGSKPVTPVTPVQPVTPAQQNTAADDGGMPTL
ncbi:MAG: hypothetical protein IK107_01595 [Oscillospiraceae bacterium]|nr:hypothetical protein [Oscillospiraceae bacterium]